LNAGYEISAVFTHADDPKEKTFFGSVAQLCAQHDIAVHAPEDANHPLWIERIAKLAGLHLFLLLPPHAQREAAFLCQKRRIQPARFAAAALSGSRAGQLGAGQRRKRNRRDPAPHGQTR
jgi:hypothetical protein